ncbi:tight adherence protein C [Hydrocarboniphaga daqingensis]|uniref:Tight adherence protein C n=1 Tax=Hydrocarboniphaga daqingensis TaxID=490188 RepID=A0A1M5NTS3_9GAMM|nr:type II secretion system F family protein [Hydrocarboniphaga daqingensis]SHG92887.1 tight adherence protein C [Hydrocarboniphaga daqingensis]
MSPGLFAALVSLTLILAALTIGALIWWGVVSSRARRVQRRLLPEAEVPNDLGIGNANPVLQGIASRGKSIEKALDSEGQSARLMIQAGWRSAEARLVFYVMQGLTPLLMLGAAFGFWTVMPERITARPVLFVLMAVAALILGVLLPSRVRSTIAASRRRQIRAEVPLFIHVLVLLFESGLSTRQAFSSLVREGRGVLTELGIEIEILLRQLEAGADMSEALTRLADALEVADLATVLQLLRQVDRYGGEVKEPLLETLQVIEDRREMDLRERVNLISGRMTVVMVLFFFPALIIFVAGPSWVSLIRALSGVAK